MRNLLLYLCLLFWLNSSAQVYNFRSFSLDQGLAQSQVYDFCQDLKGNIWIATYSGGITVYSGFETRYFSTENGLPGNYVVSLFASSDGKIWIGTTRGVAYYDGKSFTCIGSRDKLLTGTTVWDISEDKFGAIWLATNKGLWKYYDGELISFPQFERDIVYLLHRDNEDVIWIHSSDTGIVLLKDNTFEFNKFPEFEKIVVNCFYSDKKNNMWIGTSEGLYKYGKEKKEVFTVKSGLPINNAYSVVEDHKGRIWIGTYGGGLCVLDNDFFEIFTEENGLCLNKINKLFIDDQQNLWIGSDGGGASILKSHSFAYVPFEKNAGKTLVMAVLCDIKNNVWLGSEGKGLIKLKDNRRELFGTWNGLEDNTINCVYEDRAGNIWVGSDLGLNKITNNRIVDFPGSNSLKNITVMSVLEDSTGILWIGTNGEGLYVFDGKTCSKYLHPFINENAVWKIFEDRAGIKYFCTEEGLAVMFNNNIEVFTEEHGLVNNSVWTAAQDKFGYIWLGTNSGMNRFDGKEFRGYNIKSGLTSGTIYILQFDKEGNLWLGSEKGVDKIEINEHGDFLSIKHFSKDEGFTSIECNSNAVSMDKQGKIWFGTIDGAILYNPSESKSNQIPPRIHITNLKLFYDNVNWQEFGKVSSWYKIPENLVLKYYQNTITIEFAAINFSNPEKVRYKYMLEGFDNDWAPTTNKNYERYSNLPPGKYTFKVLACNDDGYWTSEPVVFSFEILPPFWKTTWFVITSIFLAALMLFLYIQLRTRKLKKSKELLAKTVRERTYEIVVQKEEIDEKRRQLELAYKDITDSVRYAQRIQKAILPDQDEFAKLFPESFILFKPKDIVSGDFFWFAETAERVLVAAVDCTGHGVPGAFMSLIGYDILNQILDKNISYVPSEILNKLDGNIVSMLHHGADVNPFVQDGMDLALCSFHKNSNIMEFAGSYRPAYVIRDNEIIEYKGDKFTAGGYYRDEKRFTNHKIELKKNDCLYIFSDGYPDQFGGEKGLKFMVKRFKKTLIEISHLPMKQQKQELNRIFAQWKGTDNLGYEQIDDVLIIGIKATWID